MSRLGFTVPPGRAGRLWLTRRLAVARRGADLLDRKLRILQEETNRLRNAAAQTAAEWDRCCADAERCLLRAAMLGGERAIRLAADGGVADVTISYGVTMGVRHPDGATCRIPASAAWDGPALAAARQAHGRALAAAVRHAAAAEALRALEAETLATRYRLRAVKTRWIPRLEQALAEVSLALEEQELADTARLRLAASGRPGAGAWVRQETEEDTERAGWPALPPAVRLPRPAHQFGPGVLQAGQLPVVVVDVDGQLRRSDPQPGQLERAVAAGDGGGAPQPAGPRLGGDAQQGGEQLKGGGGRPGLGRA